MKIKCEVCGKVLGEAEPAEGVSQEQFEASLLGYRCDKASCLVGLVRPSIEEQIADIRKLVEEHIAKISPLPR